jgi:hypothetical protein
MSSQERRRPQTEIRFPIEARQDKYDETYYIGWTDAPAQLDMSDCAFFIFLGEEPEVCIRKRRDAKDNRNRRQRSRQHKGNGRDRREDISPQDGSIANSSEYEEEELDR